MTRDQLCREIEAARSELSEARRYVRRQPADADAQIERFRFKLAGAVALDSSLEELRDRLTANLVAGQACKTAAPHVLEGYVDGALWELSWLKGRIETGRAG
jgi:hypothetical protein